MDDTLNEDQRLLLKRLIERTQSGELRWTRQPRSRLGLAAAMGQDSFRAQSERFTFELDPQLFSGAPYALKVNELGNDANPIIEIASSLNPILYSSQVNDLLDTLFKLIDARVESSSAVVQRILDDL